MKTIKQIADEIGVSKQTVRNQIAKLGLRFSLQKIANQFAIDKQQETLILQAFSKKSQSENANCLQSELVTALQSSLRFLEQENEFLRRQLEAKDQQLERLDRRLAEAQILHADTKKMMPNAEPDVPDMVETIGFWVRLFGKKGQESGLS
jgi:predicted transcriptional regulator